MTEGPTRSISEVIADLEKSARETWNMALPFFVLVLTSTIEDILEEALLAKMRQPLSGNFKRRLFQGYGPLGSFSAKVDLAFALEIINEETHLELRVLRDLRNEFAHANSPRFFDQEDVIKHLRKLKGYDKRGDNFAFYCQRLAQIFTVLKKDDPKVIAMLNSAKSWPKP